MFSNQRDSTRFVSRAKTRETAVDEVDETPLFLLGRGTRSRDIMERE